MPPPPASPFAALLRRSKFASYDPSIAQIYTSHGGDLSRGNWGFKRPLPLRRKGAYITVKAVDSKEQQTEWDPADQKGKWIQMWDEVGVTPDLDAGPWRTRLGSKAESVESGIQSEFNWPPPGEIDIEVTEGEEVELAPEAEVTAKAEEGENEAVDERILRMLSPGPGASTPNIHAMSDKQFEKYLAKVRELRPTFKAYRQTVAKLQRREAEESLWLSMSNDSNPWRMFLAKKAQEDFSAPSSRIIEQQPQRVAGLTYSRSSVLQSSLLQPAREGRILYRTKSSRSVEYDAELKASFAGMLSNLSATWRGDASEELDWNTLAQAGVHDPKRGVTKFKLIGATLSNVPPVVGEHTRSMEGIELRTHIKAVESDRSTTSNTRRPGSREYVALDGRQQIPVYSKQQKYTSLNLERRTNHENVLVSLSSILTGGSRPPPS